MDIRKFYVHKSQSRNVNVQKDGRINPSTRVDRNVSCIIYM